MLIALVRRLRRGVGLVFALLIASAADVAAQTEPADCHRIVSAVETAPEVTGAQLGALSACKASAPAALSREWMRTHSRTSEAREALVHASRQIRDRRVQEAVERTAMLSDRETDDRVAALRVLISYYDPSSVPSHAYLTGGQVGDPIPLTTHLSGGTGREPLADGFRQSFLELLASLASSDGDATVRGAALRLRQSLVWRDPESTPLPANAVTLEAACGSRVNLLSHADVGLPVRVKVLGSGFDHIKYTGPSSGRGPSRQPLGLPAGVVVAYIGTREVARLERRDTPCPPGLTK